MVMAKFETKKTPEKKASKKVVEEVVMGDKKSSSSTKFDGIFNVNCAVP